MPPCRLPGGRGAILAIAYAGFVAAGAPAAAASLTGGAGRAEIALTSAMLPIDGFSAILDPLQARVLLLNDGTRRVAIAVVDQTSIFDGLVHQLQAEIGRVTGTVPQDVLVIASHSFSAPHAFGGHPPPGTTMPADEQRRAEAYAAAIVRATVDAATQAADRLAPVRVRFGVAVSDVNINRNHPSADGWWLGADAAGPSDKTANLLALDGVDGHRVATLVNYAVQSSVMDHSIGASGGKGVTADLGGAAVRHLEQGDGIAFFLTGAAGDQMPAYTARRALYDRAGRYRTEDQGDAAYPLVDLQGERLADAVQGITPEAADAPAQARLRVVHGTVALVGQDRPKDLQQIRPTRTYHYVPGAPVQAPFVLVRIGDVAIVGVQAELSAATGAYIRQHSPIPHTMVVTMVNGAAKYMPDALAYRQMTYEAMNAPVGPGSAETFATSILRDLATLHDTG